MSAFEDVRASVSRAMPDGFQLCVRGRLEPRLRPLHAVELDQHRMTLGPFAFQLGDAPPANDEAPPERLESRCNPRAVGLDRVGMGGLEVRDVVRLVLSRLLRTEL